MRAAALLLLALLLVSGCGGSEDTPKSKPTLATPSTIVSAFPTGEVKGRLMRVGGPAGTPSVPVRGEVLIKGEDGSVARAQVDSGGDFQISLSPGRYRLQGHSPEIGDGKILCATTPAVTTLVAGTTVTVDIICSIK